MKYKESVGWNQEWEDFFSQAWGNRYPDPMVVRFIAKNFSSVPFADRGNFHILDLGCGTGPHTWFLAKEGFSVYGIDGSSSAITKAKEQLAAKNLSAKLNVGDLSKLPYADNSMDAIIDAMALQHNDGESISKTVSEVRRILKPSGMFFSMYIAEEKSKPKVYTNYMAAEQVRSLFSPIFADVRIGFIEYGWDSLHPEYKFWIIQASKLV